MKANQFGFNIGLATNVSVVVEACTNLANPVWSPLQTNTLTSGLYYFSDPQWTNYPTRIYRLGATTFGGRPTAIWRPQVQTGDASFGVQLNQFGFNMAWASGQIVVVEACTNLTNPVWSPLQTNTFTSDTLYFSDAQWTNYPARLYRLRSP